MSPQERDLADYRAWRAQGDAGAFKALCSRYAGKVYAACMRITGNAADAEDAAQQTFITLAEAKQPPKTFGPWLHGVAAKRALQLQRTEARRRTREDKFAESVPTQVTTDWNDIADFVDEVVAALPDKQRVPLYAHFYEDRTHEDIARDLGVSRQAVSYQIQRGIEAVRESLAKKGIRTSASVLTALFAAHLAQAAAPSATLTASIARIALAGPAQAAAWSIGAFVAAHKLLLGTCTVVLVASGVFLAAFNQPNQLSKPEARPIVSTEAASPTEPDSISPANDAPETTSIADAKVYERTPVAGRVIDAATGEGVSGQVVRAQIRKPNNNYLNWETKSDEDGAFEFDEHAVGRYRVWCEARAPYYTEEAPHLTEHIFQLGEGEQRNPLEMKVRRGHAIIGRIVPPEGKSLESAMLTVISPLDRIAANVEDDGSFSVAVPPPGLGIKLRPDARFEERGPSWGAYEFGPYDVPESGLRGIELPVIQGCAIKGTTVDAAGNVLDGVVIRAEFAKENNAIPNAVLERSYEESMVRDGEPFAISLGGSGTVQLSVLNTDNEYQIIQTVEMRPGQVIEDYVLTIPSHVTARDLSNPEPEMPYTFSGIVSGPAGNPIRDAQVRVGGTSFQRRSPISVPGDYAMTDEQGAFSVKMREADSVFIAVKHKDYSRKTLKDLAPNGGHYIITLEDTVAIRLHVRDGNTGDPIEAFNAELNPYRAPSHNLHQGEAYIQQARMMGARQKQGRYSPRPSGIQDIENLDAQHYLASVTAPEYAPKFQIFDASTPGETYDLQIDLDRGFEVHGTVRDSGGYPVPDAKLIVTHSSRPTLITNSQSLTSDFGRTDTNGNFTMTGMFTYNGATLHAWAPGYVSRGTNLDFRPGMPPVELTVEKAARITGKVQFLSGTSPRGAEIRMDPVETTIVNVQRSNAQAIADGSYQLDYVPPVEFELVVSKANEFIMQRVSPKPGEFLNLDFIIPPFSSMLTVNIVGEGDLGEIHIEPRVETPYGYTEHIDQIYEGDTAKFEAIPAGVVTASVTVNEDTIDRGAGSFTIQLGEGEHRHVTYDLATRALK